MTMIRFQKADRITGVDGNFTDSNPRVTVMPDEFPIQPAYPENAGFWPQFEQVILHVTQAKNYASTKAGVAKCFRDAGTLNALRAADLVHLDWPTDLALLVAKGAKSSGAAWRRFTGSNFTDTVVLLNKLMAEAAWRVSANSFNSKWHFMAPRPEEIAGLIARGELTCPDYIMMQLKDLPNWDLVASNQHKFTTYDEGCPKHPAFNAMHSAAAAAAGTIIKVMIECDPATKLEIDLGVRNVGYFRTMAGVHWQVDNDAGFWLGQETVNRFIVPELVSLGANQTAVEAALAAAQTDWIKA